MANLFVMNNSASLHDEILQLGSPNEFNYHAVQNIARYDNAYQNSDGYLMAVYIRSDRMYDSYSRQVNDILSVLGAIGGLQGALVGIGYIFVGFFAQKFFMSKIIRKIYHIRRYENLEHEA
jgi:hypothetical protein